MFIFFGFIFPVFAEHIIGGEMIYEYLGAGNSAGFRKYRVTLKLFRDQFTSGAAMPPDVFIGFFDGTKQYPASNQPYDVFKSREDDVPVNPFPPCIVNAEPISYHVGIYELIIELPVNTNGYTAAYQTCCRVNPLANVANSNSSGAGSTYSCYIPSSIDNGPQFSTNVSLICRARSFALDFSARDPDGDSLVYSFCNAFDGGIALSSGNINPGPPPYSSVIYTGGYSATSPLGRFVKIDATTGIISGTAPDVGKYVVCVCVQSYKNGIFVSEHRKDFIVKIGDCDFAGAELQLQPTSCGGFTVSFSNNNNSPLNQNYFWDFGVPSLTNDTSNLPNPTFTYPDTGTYVYKLVVNRNKPCGDSALQTIKVYPGFFPGFTWNAECVNTPIKFIDTTKSKYGVVNAWTWDFGDPFTLADTSHLQDPVYSFTRSGKPTVRLIVGDNKGCIDTLNVPVTVIDNPTVTNLFRDTVYCGRDTIQLHASSNIAGNFSWSPNTNILNANTADPLVFPTVSTKYIVKFNSVGCAGTDTVNVNPRFDFVDSIASPTSKICEEDSVTLTAITNYTPVKYLWTPAATLSSDTIRSVKASPAVATTYNLLTRWGNNCTATANTTIDVKKLAVPYAGPDTSLCMGSPGVMLNASGGDDYIWKPATGLSNPDIPNPIATPASSTNYIVSVGITGCIKRREDTVLVTLRNLPELLVTNDTLICSIDTLQLSASTMNGNKFFWTPAYIISNQNIANPLVSPDVPTTYHVQVIDEYNCVNKDSVFVDVKQFVTISTADDTTICQTDVIQLNTSGDALHYSWSPPASLNNSLEKSPLATPLTTTNYRVTGNIGKCQSEDEVTITVVPYPKAFAGNDTTICFNTSASLHATGGSNYLWSPDRYLSDATIADPIATPDTDEQYVVKVTDDKGCPKAVNDTVFVKLYPKVIADAGPRDTVLVVNQPLQLHGTGGNVYLWSPSTGLSNANVADPVARIDNNQQYVLKTSNTGGCSGTDTIDITVYKVEAGLYVPNAFTPNGDNLNDVFRPVQLGMKYLHYFKIYNRFGQLVFSTTLLNAGWDGKVNGKPQNPDIYVWIAEGIDYENKQIFKKGTVALIR